MSDYSKRLEQRYVDASRRLAGEPAPAARPRRRRRTAAWLIAAALVIGVPTLALATRPWDGPTPPAVPGAGLARVSAASAAAFPVLARPAQARDVLPRSALSILGVQQETTGVNPRLARQVVSGRFGAAYLIPGDGSLCLLVAPAGGPVRSNCTRATKAAADGLLSAGIHEPGGTLVAGVAPAGWPAVTIVTRVGRPVVLPVNPDGGFTAVLSSPPVAVKRAASPR